MTVTLSVDDQLLTEAKRLAAARGTSLDALVGDYLRELVQAAEPAEFSRRLRALSDEGGGRSGGVSFDRDEWRERPDVP
jgi:hypothetical protein